MMDAARGGSASRLASLPTLADVPIGAAAGRQARREVASKPMNVLGPLADAPKNLAEVQSADPVSAPPRRKPVRSKPGREPVRRDDHQTVMPPELVKDLAGLWAGILLTDLERNPPPLNPLAKRDLQGDTEE